MKIEQINRRFAELSEICWHVYQEQGMLYRCSCGATRECESSIIEHCDKNNPDFCAHPELVLEVMMKREDREEFCIYIEMYGQNGFNYGEASQWIQGYILNKTGNLALAAIKWMEENP
jgi:hypothetical protein